VTRSYGTWLVHHLRRLRIHMVHDIRSLQSWLFIVENVCQCKWMHLVYPARSLQIHVGRDSFMWDVTRPSLLTCGNVCQCKWIHLCAFPQMHMGRDSCIWDMTSSSHLTLENIFHWFIWDMTRSYGMWLVLMGRDLLITFDFRKYSLIHMGHDSFIWDVTRSYGTWLVHHCWLVRMFFFFGQCERRQRW